MDQAGWDSRGKGGSSCLSGVCWGRVCLDVLWPVLITPAVLLPRSGRHPTPPTHSSHLRSVEEQTLQDKMQAETHPDDFDVDVASHRLNEIYERMNEVCVCEGGGGGGGLLFLGQWHLHARHNCVFEGGKQGSKGGVKFEGGAKGSCSSNGSMGVVSVCARQACLTTFLTMWTHVFVCPLCVRTPAPRRCTTPARPPAWCVHC